MMQKKGRTAKALAGMFVLGPALAVGQSGGRPLSLAEAVQLSIQRSPAVEQAQSAYLAARARTGEIQSRRLPQLGFFGSVTRYDNRTTVTLPGMTAPFEVAPNNQEALTIALTQDLDVSGQLGLTVAQDRLNARAAQYDFVASSNDQALATTQAYYGELRAEQNVKVAQASLDAYREQQTTTTRLYKGGVGQRIDVLRADSQVAEAESELVHRNNDLAAARSTLNDLIGRPLDEAPVLEDPSAATMAAVPAGETDRPAMILQAIEHRPEALEATVAVLAAKKGIQVARTASAPGVTVSLSGSRYPTTSFELPRQNVAALTLNLSVPIFDGGYAREKVSEAHALTSSAEAQAERVRRDIALDVQNAALDVETARKRAVAAEVDLTAATAARKLAQQRFESQVGLYIEVTDAQSALTSAQAAKVQATYDLITAQARLAHARGFLLDQETGASR